METKAENTDKLAIALKNIEFNDIFVLEDMQRLQDLFSETNGVASIITHPDGTPITRPSNFCRLCEDIIRKTEKGLANCMKSDAVLGKQNQEGPNVQPCLSCSLWDAGTSITVGGKQIANWLIGQVRNEEMDIKSLLLYADEIGVNRKEYIEALKEVPLMSVEQFNKIAKLLFVFANELSEKAYKNLQLKIQLTDLSDERTLLNESEEKYRLLFENSQDAYFQSGINGKYTLVNPSAVRMFAYDSVAEMIGLSAVNLYVNPEDRDKLFEELKNSGNLKDVIIEACRKDQTKFWVSMNARFIRDTKGQIIGTEGVVRDITERKNFEISLQKSEERYKQISSSISDITYSCKINRDGSSEIDWIMGATKRILGYSTDELKKLKCWGKLVIEEDFSNFRKYVLELEANTVGHCELQLITKNGDMVWVDSKAEKIEKKGINEESYIFGGLYDITDRKIAENELKEKEERFRNLFEYSGNGIRIVNSKGIVIDENKSMSRITGIPNEEVIGKPISDIIFKQTPDIQKTPETYDRIKNVINTILKEEKFPENWTKMTNQLRYIDGTLKTIESSYFIVKTENETLFYSIIQDISDIVKAQEELIAAKAEIEKSEEKYRLLAENSKDVIWMMDINGRYIYVSPSVISLRGITAEENMLENFEEAITPESAQLIKQLFAKTISDINSGIKPESRTILLEQKCKNGSTVWTEIMISAIFDESDNFKYFLGVTRDINERKRVEEKILKMGKYYQAIIEKAPDGIALIDIQGNFKYISPAAKKMFGYDVFEEINGKPAEYTHPDDLEFVISNLLKLIQDPAYIPTLQYRFIDKNGNWKWVETTMSNLLADENVESIVLNFRDINERKSIEQELIKAKEKVDESNKLKTAFLQNISHEIRTPFNGILGFLELINEEELTVEQKNKYLTIINKSSERLMKTINDIVDISQIQAGQMEIKKTNVSISDLFSEIVKDFKSDAESKGLNLSINTQLPENHRKIYTDSSKLHAILSILTDNAIKFTASGHIEVGCINMLMHDSSSVEFYVKDTGIGIAEDNHKLIFERFMQVDVSNTRGYERSGLGLSIAKEYVEMLGGKIWLESTLDKGSTFYFTIPLKIEATEEVIPTLVSAKKEEKTNEMLKILLVEDDPTSELFIKIIVRKFCNEVLFANSGSKAIEICRNNPDINLILMDIKMSDVDGLEATKKIREFNKEVIIIAQTAYAFLSDRHKAIEAGCNDYITKPIKKNLLLEMIDKYFTL